MDDIAPGPLPGPRGKPQRGGEKTGPGRSRRPVQKGPRQPDDPPGSSGRRKRGGRDDGDENGGGDDDKA
jgi:hypothetical protein